MVGLELVWKLACENIVKAEFVEVLAEELSVGPLPFFLNAAGGFACFDTGEDGLDDV